MRSRPVPAHRRRTLSHLASVGLFVAAVTVPRGAQAGDPVGTWALDGTLRTTACARGRCQSQQTVVQDFLVVDADATFAFGTIPDPSCPSAMPVRGSWQQKPSGRVKLKGENLREWWAAISLCSGTRIRGRRFRGRFDPDAGTLVVKQPAHATVQGISVGVRIRGEFLATRVGQSPLGAFTGNARSGTRRSWVEALQLP